MTYHAPTAVPDAVLTATRPAAITPSTANPRRAWQDEDPTVPAGDLPAGTIVRFMGHRVGVVENGRAEITEDPGNPMARDATHLIRLGLLTSVEEDGNLD